MARLLIGLLLVFSFAAEAQQDRIILVSGEECAGKVTEISLTQVYFRNSTADTVLQSVPLPEVFAIVFANGTREVYPRHLEHPAAAETGLSAQQLQQLGQQDARFYYRGRGAFWGTFGGTLLNPLMGIPLAIGVSGIRPRLKPETVSDPALLLQPEYVKGYRKQAARTNRGKAALGLGAAVLTYVAVFTIASGDF